jgi:DNA-binding NtrC family response regulator
MAGNVLEAISSARPIEHASEGIYPAERRALLGASDFPSPEVLVVDDDPVVRSQLERLYSQSGYQVTTLSSAEAGLRRLNDDIDFVITDIKLPGMDGVQFISQIHQRYPDLPVIAITGYADIRTAVDVLKLGACDFVTKPFDLATILESTRAALESTKSVMEVRHLRRWLKERFQFSEMLSQTPQMHRVFEQIRAAAPTERPVLVEGEAGTGKELVAHAIHYHSERRAGPFVTIHCADFAEDQLAIELFGSAGDEAKIGKVLAAHGGTMFLNGIESLSLAMQAKLLRAIEDRKILPLGADQTVHVDFRVIAASNLPVKAALTDGRLCVDFYRCLNRVSIRLVPLHERSTDIPLLVQNFLQHHPIAKSKRIVNVSDKVLARLIAYPWPGNIRELQNLLENAVLLATGRIIEDIQLPDATSPAEKTPVIGSNSLRQWLRQMEKHYLSQKLEDLGGNVGLTAKSCRIGVRTLSRKMRSYGLDKKFYKEKDIATKMS